MNEAQYFHYSCKTDFKYKTKNVQNKPIFICTNMDLNYLIKHINFIMAIEICSPNKNNKNSLRKNSNLPSLTTCSIWIWLKARETPRKNNINKMMQRNWSMKTRDFELHVAKSTCILKRVYWSKCVCFANTLMLCSQI